MAMSSDSLVTCSTAGSNDRVPADPSTPLAVPTGGVIRVSLPAGWRFLYWEGSDHSADAEGTNVTPGGETPDRPSSIDVPAPVRSGDSILGVWAYVIRKDERVVAQIGGSVLVRLP